MIPRWQSKLVRPAIWLMVKIGLFLSFLLPAVPETKGFSLLGPFAPWMTYELSYRFRGDIGGPMDLGEEYRWTIPVVTYGFDQSFLDYFGPSGIEAVEQAIQILNDLPPASEVVITNYPSSVLRENYFTGIGLHLRDLKSATLQTLVEQLGLASPMRYVWTLRAWSEYFDENPWFWDEVSLGAPPWLTNYIVQRNFDPFTVQPSRYVNGCGYTYMLETNANWKRCWPMLMGIYCFNDSVADRDLFGPGLFYTGLALEDVAGLRYLLSRTNLNVEALDATVEAADLEAGPLVRTAARPGVEKITFLAHRQDQAGAFLGMTNRWADVYFTNSLAATQWVQRVVSRPDILFSARDLGFIIGGSSAYPALGFEEIDRTDTSNWINNSHLNGNAGGCGPGVIPFPITITFHTPDRYVAAASPLPEYTDNLSPARYMWNWGSFGASTNAIIYPGTRTNVTSFTIGTRLVQTNGINALEWTLFGRKDARYRMDCSSNLWQWSSVGMVTNTNGFFRFTHPLAGTPQFIRAVLECSP